MKVLQICAGFDVELLGGVERYTLDLSRALVRHGVDVAVAGLWRFGTPREKASTRALEDAGIRTFSGAPKSQDAPLRNFAAAIAGLQSTLTGYCFDVIHSQQEFGDFAAIALQHTVHAHALIRSIHNQPEWRARPLRRLLFTRIAAPFFFALETGITDGITAELATRATAQLLRRRPITIHNAVELNRFAAKPPSRADARAELGWPAERFIIGTVGRLSPQKGLFDLLAAAAALRETMPDVQFRIVGAGEQREALEREIAAHDMQDLVILDGARTAMHAVYAAMDCLASSSLWEGLPTVILEAMLCGTPVVATAIEGTTELVRHEQTGLLTPVCDPQSLAATLSALRAAPELRARIIFAARQLAKDYSIDRVVEQWLTAYANATVQQ